MTNFEFMLVHLKSSNTNNTVDIISDQSYVLIGHNEGDLCANESSNSEVPSGQDWNRLEREWKIHKTNFSDVFSIDIKDVGCEISGNEDMNHVFLLVDDDGDFSNSNAFGIDDGLSFSSDGEFFSISGISNDIFPNNENVFFTIAAIKPNIELNTSEVICEGDSVVINFTIEDILHPVVVVYSDGTNEYEIELIDSYSVTIYPIETTTISVLGSHIPNMTCCLPNDYPEVTIEVINTEELIINSSSDYVCEGDSLNLSVTGTLTYFWEPDIISGENFLPDSSETYSVLGINEQGCEVFDSIFIPVYQVPNFSLPSDSIICFNESIYLELDELSNFTYLWQNEISGNSYTITEPGLYWVDATSEFCSINDSIFVEMILCSSALEMPNIFTPNDDQINDTFLPLQYDLLQNFEIRIYNRWGTELFVSYDPEKGWDGTYQGDSCPDGTYYWVVNTNGDFDDPIKKSGTITLLR